MQYIEKIEISKFRSFGENNTIECGKINIFSGSNDSGKSNVIKALNLFFNEKTDIFTGFNPENDFNKWFKDRNARGQRNITIKVYIKKGAYKDPKGINAGFIAEKVFGIDGSIQTNFYLKGQEKEELILKDDSASYKRADAVIRNQIRFIYVPAIRDSDFRRYIQRQMLEITNSGSGKLGDIFKELKTELDTTFKSFGEELHKFIDINVLSDVNFATLLESMSFSTDEQITIKKIGRGGNIDEKQNIPIANRGDGIQMQFLSFLLWFIANKDTNHKYIWGFEEPEIAYEFQKQFQMADIFANTFSKNAQIFITTHSPAFISFNPNNGKNSIYQYRIHKVVEPARNNRSLSVITNLSKYVEGDLFDKPENPTKALFQDLWGVNYQRLANSLGDILKNSQDYIELERNYQIIADEINKSKEEIVVKQAELERLKTAEQNNYPNKLFICEDAKGGSIWPHLFEEFGIKGVQIKSSKGCSNDQIEIVFSYKIQERPKYSPRIFRQLDRDAYLPEQISFIEAAMTRKFANFQHYKISFLPVNEIENFAILSNPKFSNELIRQNEQRYESVKDACFDTANSNLEKCRRTYLNAQSPDKDKNLFNRHYID
ncbi:hypothetical protein CE91St16_23290 [Alistipes finegoldii]|uniref:Endonuclease GajA/Old nuclease/RecF-like AAA domain-containing protein n=1 Tax=Alistipes finegoldii TaxID=214856 RepID=A0AA37NLZ7_9BACT|nr:AAA family ATPase [Alistipes finegoldii]BDF65922.1 hypothetical protein CE91St15_34080 [Alistipes finegoldii]GKI19421.1 hypothetical protein CE91St16_23290 [Alistipes finegoldii]